MKGVLLTKKSSFQIYAANYLYKEGVIDSVIFEGGSPSFAEKKNIFKLLKSFFLEFNFSKKLIIKVQNKIFFKRYFGNKSFHDKRILKTDFTKINNNLISWNVENINDLRSFSIIKENRFNVIYVFGTNILKKNILSIKNTLFINLHWGLSPLYRGEGIISALSREGPKGLGVTIHFVDENIDSGDILYQSKPEIDPQDNFYSIGLKLTLLGLKGFKEINKKLKTNTRLNFKKQNLKKGSIYTSKFIKKNPEIILKAWKVLKSS